MSSRHDILPARRAAGNRAEKAMETQRNPAPESPFESPDFLAWDTCFW